MDSILFVTRYFVLILFVMSCGSSKDKDHAPVVSDPLKELYAKISGWVKPCEFEGVEYPCERSGDSTNEDHVTMWSGLSCLASNKFCEVPALAQSDEGKVWRSPSQINIKNHNSSSRDMFLGFLAAMTKTKNHDALWRAYQYIRAHDNKLCEDADDNRCDMRPEQYRAIWGSLSLAFKEAGLKTTPTIDDAAQGDDLVLWGQAKASPIGYQLHLVAVQLHIRKYVKKWSKVLQETAEILAKKDSDNAYFEWLAYGPTYKAIKIVLERCSKEPGVSRDDWIWSASSDSMGYDCLFMIDLLTGA
jgi:hypothetical protein